jgi:hypothetical protein
MRPVYDALTGQRAGIFSEMTLLYKSILQLANASLRSNYAGLSIVSSPEVLTIQRSLKGDVEEDWTFRNNIISEIEDE